MLGEILKCIARTPILALTNHVGWDSMNGSQPTEMSMTPKEKASKLTPSWLREHMHYDPNTGHFMWIKPGQGRTVGKRIGSRLWSKGLTYLSMRVNGDIHFAHRLAWFYHYGEWPSGIIDHIDGDRANNAIGNLRIATHAQNAARRPTNRGIAPSRGVFPHGVGYVARIHSGGKRHYLGYFSTAEQAKVAYETAAKKIHGEFAHPTEEASKPRGDYMQALQCEMCGIDAKDADHGMKIDRTDLGQARGCLCFNCWSFVYLCNANKVELQRKFRNAMRYIDRLDVFDDKDLLARLTAPLKAQEATPDG